MPNTRTSHKGRGLLTAAMLAPTWFGGCGEPIRKLKEHELTRLLQSARKTAQRTYHPEGIRRESMIRAKSKKVGLLPSS